MDQNLQNNLITKYPSLFANTSKSPQESCMAFGIECGNGWYDIISALCWRIKQYEDNIKARERFREKQNNDIQQNFGIAIEGDGQDYFPVKFDQIKEKFGGLRIYYSGGDDYISGAVDMVEEISYKICEVCGQKGKPNKGGWITTLCESCKTPKGIP